MQSAAARLQVVNDGGPDGLTPWEYALAKLLSDAGYATALYGKWHLGTVEGRLPTNQGFDEWYGIPRSTDERCWKTCSPPSIDKVDVQTRTGDGRPQGRTEPASSGLTTISSGR